MSDIFYQKPLALGNIIGGRLLEQTDPGRSVSQNIELLILSHYGEHRHDKRYGCEIWELDFELIVSERAWEEKFRQSLLRSVKTYEQRIYQVEVEIKMSEVEKLFFHKQVSEVKKQVEITLRAKMSTTGEVYFFTTLLFLSPLSS